MYQYQTAIRRSYQPQYKPLPQEEVLSLAEKFHNIKKVEFLCPTTLKIQTLYDTFYCEITDRCLILKHQICPKKQHTHLQRVFKDYKFLFESLARNDTYKFTKRGTCTLDYLYSQIGNNRRNIN